jgi:hypothetical protein
VKAFFLDKKVLYVTLFLLLIFLLSPAIYGVLAKKDKTPPTGSIVINNGDSITTSTSVSLMLTAEDPESGVKEVRYSNDGDWNKPWERFQTTKSWTLTSEEGIKTVYYQVKNNNNLISATYSDSIVLKYGNTPDPTPEPTPTPKPTFAPEPIPDPTPKPEPTPKPTLPPMPTPEPTSTPAIAPTPEPTTTPPPAPKPTSTPKIDPDPTPNAPSTSPPPYPSPSNKPIAGGSESTELEKLVIVGFVIVTGGTLIFLSLKLQKKNSKR